MVTHYYTGQASYHGHAVIDLASMKRTVQWKRLVEGDYCFLVI
jgi:hypothetical protein